MKLAVVIDLDKEQLFADEGSWPISGTILDDFRDIYREFLMFLGNLIE